MSKESVIRALVVADSPDEAEQITSMIRTSGHAARTVRVETGDELIDALEGQQFDILVHMLESLDIELKDVLKITSERSSLLSVIAAGEGELTAAQAMRMGAADRVTPADSEHLRRALAREFDAVRARRRARDLETIYRESEARARALMESSRDAIAYIHAGMHVVANDAYLERFGYTSFEELEGMPMMDMIESDNQAKIKEFLRSFSTSEEAVGNIQLKLRKHDGASFEAEVEFSRATIEGEACSQIIIRDPGNAEELERQLSMLSQRDSVTGLYNHQHFMKLLGTALAAAEKEQQESALLQLQIDDFATVRNNVGVLGADQVIADVGEVLAASVDEQDSLARMDGATYALLTNRSDPEELEALATRLREQVKDHICEVRDQSVTVTISIGITRIDGSTSDPNDILSRTERALTDARDKGANNHLIYKPKPGELSQKQIDQEWAATIRDILKQDRLRLLYQPVVSLTGDTAPRYEVKVEILDENHEPMENTAEVLAAADRTGMSKGLDRWIVLNAFRRLASATREQPATIFLIPLSGHAFEDTGLFRWIHDRIKQLELPPAAIVFQADATAAATRLKRAGAFATAVHKIGCGMALSGFGHGAEPFQLLRHVEVDYLRVHEDFMHGLGDNQDNQEALREIATQARDAGNIMICPGITDARSLTVIWSVGTDMIQGDFLQEASVELDYDFSSMSM